MERSVVTSNAASSSQSRIVVKMDGSTAATWLRQHFPDVFHNEFARDQIRFIRELMRFVEDDAPAWRVIPDLPRSRGTTSIKAGLNLFLICHHMRPHFVVDLDAMFVLLKSLERDEWGRLVKAHPHLAKVPGDDLVPLEKVGCI